MNDVLDSARLASADLPMELPLEALRWSCPLDLIPAETTEGVEPVESIIGQDRALKALKMGVELFSPGYNIFVCGLSGTGKATTIKTILEKIQLPASPPFDLCYVHNFRDPDRPILLRFPAGLGASFRDEMAEALTLVKARIPLVFEGDEFLGRRQAIIEEYNRKEAELFRQFEQTIIPDGFVLGRVQEGQAVHPEILAKIGDKTVLISDLAPLIESAELTEEAASELLEKYQEHNATMQGVFRAGLLMTREYQKLVVEHEQAAVSVTLQAVFTDVIEAFPDEKSADYIMQVISDILGSLDRFKEKSASPDAPEDDFAEYTVNLLLDNTGVTSCPVVIETAPTFSNLFGGIERVQDAQGFWFADFTRIKAGSLLRADGGFLVLNAADTLSEPGVWRMLQRVLLYRKLEIQSLDTALPGTSTLKPEAIDLNLKVILIGNNEIYWALNSYERDFKKIFKIKADFDNEMPNTELAVRQYAALIRKLISDEGLRHFDNKALAVVVEYGARLSESKKKLTTQFSEIADIVREANYWCAQNSNKYVTDMHVRKAIEETRDRHSLGEDKLQELIDNEVILIDSDGERVGQINGLAVYGGDRFDFGKPARITASVSAGKAGFINIEREARMSGSTHDKGMQILAGYLRGVFAQKHPLTLSASVSFEQSYTGIDGDSASSTEIYALLSALSGIPIRQRYAVTGSVNQKGDIQPIGGVNVKIEGFFDVCRKRGLTGAQGVVIPIQNIPDLMLRNDVVDAVRAGRFHVYAVSTVAQGIEILTGIAAGAPDAQGNYPVGTVYGRVQQRLQELAEAAAPRKQVKGDR